MYSVFREFYFYIGRGFEEATSAADPFPSNLTALYTCTASTQLDPKPAPLFRFCFSFWGGEYLGHPITVSPLNPTARLLIDLIPWLSSLSKTPRSAPAFKITIRRVFCECLLVYKPSVTYTLATQHHEMSIKASIYLDMKNSCTQRQRHITLCL